MEATKRRKVQRSITLDAQVDDALPALQKKLEETLYPYGGNKALEMIHGPVKYNTSNTIQMAITKLMHDMGVDPWRGKAVALDLASGEPVSIPDGEEIKDSAETK